MLGQLRPVAFGYNELILLNLVQFRISRLLLKLLRAREIKVAVRIGPNHLNFAATLLHDYGWMRIFVPERALACVVRPFRSDNGSDEPA